MLNRSIILTIFCLFVPSQGVSEVTGKNLYHYCVGISGESEAEQMAGIYCMAYLAGVNDMNRLTTEIDPKFKTSCLPEKGIANEVAALKYVEWAESNEELLNQGVGAAISVVASMKSAFPCPKK